jgi:hypothetical protein
MASFVKRCNGILVGSIRRCQSESKPTGKPAEGGRPGPGRLRKRSACGAGRCSAGHPRPSRCRDEGFHRGGPQRRKCIHLVADFASFPEGTSGRSSSGVVDIHHRRTHCTGGCRLRGDLRPAVTDPGEPLVRRPAATRAEPRYPSHSSQNVEWAAADWLRRQALCRGRRASCALLPL